MNQTTKSKAIIGAIIAVIILLVIILLPKKQGTAQSADVLATQETSGAGAAPSQTASASSTAASPYKDGTYTATGDYDSPAGPESILVTLTLQDGVIVNSNVVSEAPDAHSQGYQEKFISGYKQYVIGKNIDQVNLGAVSGSSLTPQGFNNAVGTIKTEASA